MTLYIRRTNDDRLGLVQVVDDSVGEVQVSLDEIRRRQRQPLTQADVLVAI